MKFFTCYKWHYLVKGHVLFDEDLDVEVSVNKDKTWKITQIIFIGPGRMRLPLSPNESMFKTIAETIEKDPKFNQSVLNETL